MTKNRRREDDSRDNKTVTSLYYFKNVLLLLDLILFSKNLKFCNGNYSLHMTFMCILIYTILAIKARYFQNCFKLFFPRHMRNFPLHFFTNFSKGFNSPFFQDHVLKSCLWQSFVVYINKIVLLCILLYWVIKYHQDINIFIHYFWHLK